MQVEEGMHKAAHHHGSLACMLCVIYQDEHLTTQWLTAHSKNLDLGSEKIMDQGRFIPHTPCTELTRLLQPSLEDSLESSDSGVATDHHHQTGLGVWFHSPF